MLTIEILEIIEKLKGVKKSYSYSCHPKTNINNMWVYFLFLFLFLDMVSWSVYITDINFKKR